MPRDPLLLLQDISEAADRIARYVEGLDKDSFKRSEISVDAVVRCITVIGEAVKQVPSDIHQGRPEIPWRRIASMRDRVVHDYFGVDLELVWEVATVHLPPFAASVRAMIEQLEP